jgi:hypothetical protein
MAKNLTISKYCAATQPNQPTTTDEISEASWVSSLLEIRSGINPVPVSSNWAHISVLIVSVHLCSDIWTVWLYIFWGHLQFPKILGFYLQSLHENRAVTEQYISILKQNMLLLERTKVSK